MGKKFCFALILLVFPIMVFAEEYITITYDANDGSGRTKTFQIQKGDSYTIEPCSIFEYIDPNPNDFMDDMVITEWNTKADNSGTHLRVGYTYSETDRSPYYVSIYNIINDWDNITLYGSWEGRADIASGIKQVRLTGLGAVPTDDGSYTLSHEASFDMEINIEETSMFQFSYLNYFEIPDYFDEYLDGEPEIKAFLEEKCPFVIKINYNGGVIDETGYFYLNDNKFFIDNPPENLYSNSSTNMTINYNFGVTVTYENINNRRLLVKTVVINNKADKTLVIYPKGNIFVKYVDADTGEVFDSVTTRDVIGLPYTPIINEYDGYELVTEVTDNNYEYEEHDQEIVFKFRKVANGKEEPKEDDSNEHNPETVGSLPVVLILLFVITGVVTTVLYDKKRLLIKK
ncbi:MAG: MucBP domain-containing protein [Bacilli bacterium]|nr:MucBP domain-containing protein [Bacilli bacterium]